ncbi:MFS transporter [Streptomyces boncukensis]|uniref:MFS transporter n=1 Tax=Streptomyces boncukensis TaxID=2711219 RepID=A0A6G4WZD5_9ACTN|nr:MFS transporter [Streptomyces boncukensis]NGO70646.1 MFS transporter [Streptomyces boncukensis]
MPSAVLPRHAPAGAPPSAPAPHHRHGPVLALMSSCVVLAVALVAAVNLALPKLAGSGLHPTHAELVWIVDAYVLAFACLLIPAGALGDRRGRKGALLAGLAVFAAGCLLAALAPAPEPLIAARALSGAGAALIMPATLSLALQTAPPDRKAHAVAIWTGATGAAGMVGNLGGGLVLQYLPWQGLFWVSLPLALLLLALVARLAPRTAPSRTAGPADPLGTALLVLGSVALVAGIVEGPEHGWSSAPVLGSFAAAAVLLAAFAGYSAKAGDPLIDPRVFRIPKLRAGTLGVAATFIGLFALFFVNAQYLQYAKGYSPALTGLATAPVAVGMIVVARLSPWAVRRWGGRPVVALGLAAVTAGLALLSLLTAGTPYLAYAGVLLVMAMGMGLSMPPLSTAILGSLPAERAGLGSGLNSAAREFGSALGIAVMGTVLAGRTLTDGMSAGFRLVAGAVAVLGAVTVLWFREPAGAPEATGSAGAAGAVR